MYYFKRFWDETTGNEWTGSWGTSCFYFETAADYWPTRQIQLFDNGNALKYTTEFVEDLFGGLAECALDKDDFERYAIDAAEFELLWATVSHYPHRFQRLC
ncbi:hypothetical protein [Hymenobacter metallicola]|uniref:Uncharacterized protein n=1 Tax=Hymenobacter metallicola TaxID=2563114 RepID=A0A4Z0QE01_9BACT|nr:hypothetical protein [Hymenobacter metallicola]TGE27945.1 hypothetical protein E5K02_00330 [Hymenobacter metallicola]